MSNQSGEWLSIREAALALGTSELTVRRRVKDGRLPSRLDRGKYYVQVSGAAPEPVGRAPLEFPQRDETPPRPPVGSPALNLDSVFAEHARLAEIAGKAQSLEEQLKMLQHGYATLQEGAMALANRNGWLESKLEERNLEIKLLTDGRTKPSWWRRWFRGE